MIRFFPYVVPYGTGFTFSIELLTRGTSDPLASAPLASGDVTISIDNGSFANLNTLPSVSPSASIEVLVTVSNTEMTGGQAFIRFSDQTSPPAWEPVTYVIIIGQHASGKFPVPIANVTQFGGTAGTFSSGRPEVNTTHWSGTANATPDTAGYPKVTVKSGTGTGEISLTSGVASAALSAAGLAAVSDLTEFQRGHHTATGSTFYVDGVSGNDSTGTGSRTAPYKTVSKALSVCTSNAHDRIILLPNASGGPTTITETATISVTKNYVQIRGPGRDVNVTLNTSGHVFDISANGVQLSGMRITTNSGASSDGVNINSAADFVSLSRCFIESAHRDGVQLNVANNCVIEDCTIVSAARDGIRVSSGAGSGARNAILRNVIRQSVADGVNLQGSDASYCRIQANVIRDCVTGIEIASGVVATVVTDNRFGGNTTNLSDAGTNTSHEWNRLATDVTTGAISTIGSDAITSSSFAAGAINAAAVAADAIGASELATDAAAEIAAAVWDLTRSGHATAGTFGEGIPSVQGNVTGNVTGSVGSIASGGITSSSFASGAITAASIAADAIGASELATDAAAEIAAAVWDLTRSGHATAGTFGEGIPSVQGNVTGNVTGSIGSVASGGITSSSFAAGAINAASIAADAIGASELASDAATEIAAAVWNSVRSSYTTSGTFGSAAQILHEGTAQDGSSSSIDLASGAISSNDAYIGGRVVINGGTGAGQARTIYSYVGATRTAYVFPPWTTAPDPTSTYRVTVGGGSAAREVWDIPRSTFTSAGSMALVNQVIDDGTAQTGGSTSITLKSGTTFGTNEINGAVVYIFAGTGAGQAKQITAYDSGTKIATVDSAWATTPTNSSRYILLQFYVPAASGSGDWTSTEKGQIRYRLGVDGSTDVPSAAPTLPVSVASGGITSSSFASGAITAASIAADAIGASELAADAAAEIAAAVWDLTRSGHATAGTFGEGIPSVQGNVTGSVGSIASGGITSSSFASGAITAASIAADAIGASELASDAATEIAAAVWGALRSSYTTSGTFGAALQTVLHEGTAQDGSSTSIDLASGASSSNDAYFGGRIQILGGTGAGQARTIYQYVGATRTAYVFPAWATAPDPTSTYRVFIGGGSAAREVWDIARNTFTTAGSMALANQIIDDGTAQTGGATSITLKSGTTFSADELIGAVVYIFAGVGAGQSKQITDYDASTKVATVDSAWATNPTSSSRYLLLPYYVAAASGSGDWSTTEKNQIRYRLGIDGSTASPSAAPTLPVTMAAGGISAASFATDAITAAALATDAVNEIAAAAAGGGSIMEMEVPADSDPSTFGGFMLAIKRKTARIQ